MGQRTRSVKENRGHQAKRVANVLHVFQQRHMEMKNKRLERWMRSHPDTLPPRHIAGA